MEAVLVELTNDHLVVRTKEEGRPLNEDALIKEVGKYYSFYFIIFHLRLQIYTSFRVRVCMVGHLRLLPTGLATYFISWAEYFIRPQRLPSGV